MDDNARNICCTALNMLDGVMNGNTSNSGRWDDLSSAWDGLGFTGFCDWLTDCAEYCHTIEERYAMGRDYPGVFVYEVADPFGQWVREYMLVSDDLPADNVWQPEIDRMVRQFFLVIDDEKLTTNRAVECPDCGGETKVVQRTGLIEIRQCIDCPKRFNHTT